MMFILENGEVAFPLYRVGGKPCYSEDMKNAMVMRNPEGKVENVETKAELIAAVKGRKFASRAQAQAFIEGTDIDMLKELLSESDYQIIKSMECSLLGLEVPYDIKKLHEMRQGIRDRINTLERVLEEEAEQEEIAGDEA